MRPEVTTSGCIHPPGTPRDHMCIWECSIWILGPDGWVRVDWPKSMHAVRAWLDLCDTWDDVLALSPDLLLQEVPRDNP